MEVNLAICDKGPWIGGNSGNHRMINEISWYINMAIGYAKKCWYACGERGAWIFECGAKKFEFF